MNRLLDFEILIDDSFVNFNDDSTLSPTNNKWVLSILNDYEDGRWRYPKFQSFIWDNVAEAALSSAEREALVDKSHTLLVSAAQNLRLTDRADPGKGSEIAEIVLYAIMKHHYSALPVVPKIFYKQNRGDPAKGADSVHIVIEEGGSDFSLWFGEAKFYSGIEDTRLSTIVDSVRDTLNTQKLKKENSIITNVGDLDDLIKDSSLLKSIKEALDNKKSIDSIKSKLHVRFFSSINAK